MLTLDSIAPYICICGVAVISLGIWLLSSRWNTIVAVVVVLCGIGCCWTGAVDCSIAEYRCEHCENAEWTREYRIFGVVVYGEDSGSQPCQCIRDAAKARRVILHGLWLANDPDDFARGIHDLRK